MGKTAVFSAEPGVSGHNVVWVQKCEFHGIPGGDAPGNPRPQCDHECGVVPAKNCVAYRIGPRLPIPERSYGRQLQIFRNSCRPYLHRLVLLQEMAPGKPFVGRGVPVLSGHRFAGDRHYSGGRSSGGRPVFLSHDVKW